MKTVVLLVIFTTILGLDCIIGAYIRTGISKEICSSLRRYVATNKLEQKLKRHAADVTASNRLIRWTKCVKPGKLCRPFVLEEIPDKSNQGHSNIYTSTAGAATAASEGDKSSKTLSIIVTLKSQQNCSAREFPKSYESAHAMDITSTMLSLQEHARRTQKGILDLLETKTRSKTFAYDRIDALWLINAICIRGASLSDVEHALGGHPDVLSVRKEELLSVTGKGSEPSASPRRAYDDIINRHWGVKEVGAPKVWAQGYNGPGIIVGQIDTGVDVSHEALVDNYRKDYGWFDPFNYTAEPRWTHDHGTQVIGIAVGRRGIGVAPGGRFITCLGCTETGDCIESALIMCAQWLYCPTDTDGKNPDCTKRPHVINISIAGPPTPTPKREDYWNRFSAAVDCWRSVGIIPVAGIGNSGATCGNAGYPAVLTTVIGVGNLQQLGGTININSCGHRFVRVSGGSSRGPPLPYWNGTIKPDLSAPGDSIMSSAPENEYNLFTGTSMACPHVVGVVALMLQKDPTLTFDAVKEILASTATRVEKVSLGNDSCGGIPESTFPNNAIGYGMVNAPKAISRIKINNS